MCPTQSSDAFRPTRKFGLYLFTRLTIFRCPTQSSDAFGANRKFDLRLVTYVLRALHNLSQMQFDLMGRTSRPTLTGLTFDGGCPGAVVEDGQLPEHLACAHVAQLLSLLRHFHLALCNTHRHHTVRLVTFSARCFLFHPTRTSTTQSNYRHINQPLFSVSSNTHRYTHRYDININQPLFSVSSNTHRYTHRYDIDIPPPPFLFSVSAYTHRYDVLINHPLFCCCCCCFILHAQVHAAIQ